MQYSGTISTLMEQGKISLNFEGSNSLFVHLMKGLFFNETTTLLIQNIKQNREFLLKNLVCHISVVVL